jgi:hypothetical protein
MKHPGALPACASVVLGMIAALVLVLSPTPASAYPQFTFKGAGDCASCHHSPTGGGFANRWGRESVDATFETGLGFGNSSLSGDAGLNLDLGVDTRIVPLYSADADAAIGPRPIPMLTEVGGALGYGRWVLYGGLTTVKPQSAARVGVGSREHWLLFRAAPGLELRLGRLTLPFGIRQPDHTHYVREDVGMGMYDQSYSAEVDYRHASWGVFFNAFLGDWSRQPPPLQEQGAVATVRRDFQGGSALGVSGLAARSDARDRSALSLFGQVALGDDGYLMGEFAAQRARAREFDARFSTFAEFGRLGWFALPELDLYVEAEHRQLTDVDALIKSRAALGANWQVTNFFEFAPQVRVESRSGLPERWTALAQLHVIY